ncbi:MAG: hypothetical protein JW910_16305, partial [Anaerolineae bacterium]|nr:hypothetical protein [Anaerolineae bacterium]
ALPGASLTAQAEERIVIGTTDFPRSLDPADADDYPSWELLTHLYTGLTRQIPGTLEFELALAADHAVSEDGLVHTFTVRDNAAFADGTPITAQTFVDSINRVIDQARQPAELILDYVAAVTVGEGNTVQITLRSPLPDVVALVALPMFFPVHPDVYPAGDLLDLETLDELIGNGPYRLETFRPSLDVTLSVNPAYDGPAPANDGVIIRAYTLPIDLRLAVLGGEVDVAWRALATPDVATLNAADDVMVEQQPNLQVFYMLFNQTPGSFGNQQFFDDEVVRHAFALLVNRERAADRGFENTVLPLYNLLPPDLGFTVLEFPGYDREQADAVLEAGGYMARRSPVNASLYISTDAYGDLMGSAVNEIRRGLDDSLIVSVNFTQDDAASTFIRAVERGEYLAAIIGWRPLFPSPAAYLMPLAHSSARIPRNSAYSNSDLDLILERAALSTDFDAQDTAYQEAQAHLLAAYTLLPLWQGQDTIAYQAGVSGVLVESNSWLHYDLLSK